MRDKESQASHDEFWRQIYERQKPTSQSEKEENNSSSTDSEDTLQNDGKNEDCGIVDRESL